MATDAPDGLINQHVVTSVKPRKPVKKAVAAEPAAEKPVDDEPAASKSVKAK